LLVADRAPLSVRYLMPLAERWGIGDDVERNLAVENASEAERSELIEQVAVAPDEVWSWLGDSDEGEARTPEYVAFTCLTIAADAARAMRS
jgi:hypothetical protein